jgi:hypothetical protein
MGDFRRARAGNPSRIIPIDGAIRFILSSSTTNEHTAVISLERHGERLDPIERRFSHSSGDRTTEIFTYRLLEGAEVVGLNVTAAGKRGQNYLGVYIFHRKSLVHRLARGYVYDGGDLELGQDDEPGPGGGEGHVLPNPIHASETLGGDGVANFTVPTNAIRLYREIVIIYSTTATVGTRSIRVDLLDENSDPHLGYLVAGGLEPGASTTRALVIYPSGTGDAVRISGVAGVVWKEHDPFPLPEGWSFQVDDANDVDNNDAVLMRGIVEEWIRP